MGKGGRSRKMRISEVLKLKKEIYQDFVLKGRAISSICKRKSVK